MEWYFTLIIAVAVTALFALIFTLGPAVIIYKSAFGRRQDKNPYFKYYTENDFGLTAEHMSVYYCGMHLAGTIYSVKPVEECEKVVIFQHGFGAGSSSYITEIAHFAGQGNAVIAVDAYGCNNSQGKNIKGFYAGAEAVIAEYIGVNCEKRLAGKPVVLVGHSWGAYSVLAASATVKVDGVVAISAFDSPAKCVCDILKKTGGLGRLYAPLVYGWVRLINLIKFGFKGNLKASTAIKKSGVKALLIHGEMDNVVNLKNSAAVKCADKNAIKLILPDKRHNPYNTVPAEDKLAELTGGNKFESEEQAKDFFENFDWKAATEEDEEVMKKIDGFIESL